MQRILSDQLKEHAGRRVTLCGWVHRQRHLGAVSFVILRDRRGTAQLVYNAREVHTWNNESVIRVSGVVAENAKAPGGVELQVENPAEDMVLLSSEATSETPLAIHGDSGGVGLHVLLDNRALALRYPRIRDIFVIQAAILKHFADYMRAQDFTEIKSSKIVGGGTEGGSALFEVDYFGSPAFLAQSPQFYKQAMVASGMERVFEIGACYRAEKHDSPRHLNEYISLDVEMGFIESETELMDVEVGILHAIFEGLRADCTDILARHRIVLPEAQALEAIPRISYEQALEIIESTTEGHVLEINPEGERVLSRWALEKYGIDALFVHSFPRKKRPFYTAFEGRRTRSFDLIFHGLEITTGGMRIHKYEVLLEVLPKFGVQLDAVADYLTVFRNGCPPHGGFAIGLERLTQKVCGLANVKEAALFPRDRTRLRP